MVDDLMFPPIFYAAFGFWMYGNRSIFENHVKLNNSLYDPIRYDHRILDSLTYVQIGTPFLILFVISIVLMRLSSLEI